MLTLEIRDRKLQKKLAHLLDKEFKGDPERMMVELLRPYQSRMNRLKYSGILKWDRDGLVYQKEVRSEWE
jgi:hypothetical protein